MQYYIALLKNFSKDSFALELLWWTRLMMLFATVYFGLKISLLAKNVWTNFKELKSN